MKTCLNEMLRKAEAYDKLVVENLKLKRDNKLLRELTKGLANAHLGACETLESLKTQNLTFKKGE